MKVKVIGQRARSQCKKNLFSMTLHSGFDIWLCDKMSWGSRSKVTGSRSNVTWVKVN